MRQVLAVFFIIIGIVCAAGMIKNWPPDNAQYLYWYPFAFAGMWSSWIIAAIIMVPVHSEPVYVLNYCPSCIEKDHENNSENDD